MPKLRNKLHALHRSGIWTDAGAPETKACITELSQASSLSEYSKLQTQTSKCCNSGTKPTGAREKFRVVFSQFAALRIADAAEAESVQTRPQAPKLHYRVVAAAAHSSQLAVNRTPADHHRREFPTSCCSGCLPT